MFKETKNWIESSDYDAQTAAHMLQTGRFIYVIFMCHLAIEKILKAIVQEGTGKLPNKTHDLIYLIQTAKIILPEHLMDFIGKINNASIVTRYPEDLSKLISSYPEQVARDYLNSTHEVIAWLKKDTRLMKL
ncbi:MAG: HEPN domain-containing protein [Deltaproteobacteria bacterium]|nr:HEPN domain-containing protein [Deltaproteobacteria bacterium]